MRIPVRYRLTLLFTLLSSTLIFLSSAVVFFRVSRSLHKDFRKEMIHDGRILAELFKEELKLNSLKEFEEEIHEFDLELQVLDQKNKPAVQSEGWKSLGVTIHENDKEIINRQPLYKELMIQGMPYALFGRTIHIPDDEDYSLFILRDQDSLHKYRWTFLKWMLIVDPIMILVAALVGHLFTKRMLKAETQAFDRLKSFTADASHELRIPLTSLRGHLEVALRKNRSPVEYQQIIQNALEEAEQLSQLTQDLLLLAQGDAGPVKLNIQNTDVGEFMKSVFSLMESYPDKKNIKKIMLPVPDMKYRFDPERIQQLLLILMDNAIKYGRDHGTMTLAAAHVGGRLHFIVRDDGLGISKEDQGKIFERFYRVDKSRSRQDGGSGLGLSIAQWIVEAHGGRIKVNSQIGQGSEFTVILL